MRFPAVDLFSGAGGLSLGMANAGFDVLFGVEQDEAACRTHEKNVGPCLQRDVADMTGTQVLRLAGLDQGELALIAGGPPCQGFSVQRRGSDLDARNDLVLHFIRLVAEAQPATFLMENVPALQGERGRPYLASLLERAEDAGYQTHWRVLNAADYGVPQGRRRLFVVGSRAGHFEWPSPTHQPGSYVTVRDSISNLPAPWPKEFGPPELPNHELGNMSELNQQRISHVPPGGGRADIPEDLQLPCHRVSVDKAGHRGVYGRLKWDEPANTITTRCNSFTRGRFAHPEADRNITMREAARLQAFSDDFVFLGGRVQVAHQVGNAVPPLLAEHLGRQLIRTLRGAA